MKSARFGSPVSGSVRAWRTASAARAVESATPGVLGEESERVGLRLGELVVAVRRDDEAADDLAMAVDGRRHGRPQAVGGEHLDVALAAAVGVRDQQALLDDRPAAEALLTGPRRSTARRALVDTGAGSQHEVRRVVLVDQAQADDLASRAPSPRP